MIEDFLKKHDVPYYLETNCWIDFGGIIDNDFPCTIFFRGPCLDIWKDDLCWEIGEIIDLAKLVALCVKYEGFKE